MKDKRYFGAAFYLYFYYIIKYNFYYIIQKNKNVIIKNLIQNSVYFIIYGII